MIDLKYQIASEIKMNFYFDGNWILISEVTFDSFIIPIAPLIQSRTNESSEILFFSINFILISISTILIVLILALIISLTQCLFNKSFHMHKTYFTPITHRTGSTTSTTSSQIDMNSSQHRYATIGSANSPYFSCTNGNISPNQYRKLASTTTLLRSPSIFQQHHIEGVCGNSSYYTRRIFALDFNQNQFIPSNRINIKQKIDTRHQILGGGEVNEF